jgi:hypothetical protein
MFHYAIWFCEPGRSRVGGLFLFGKASDAVGNPI